MNNLAATNLQHAKLAIEHIKGREDAIIEAEQGATGLDSRACMSNLMLLLDDIVRLYSDEDQAKYFPHHGDSEIYGQLAQVAGHAANFAANQTADYAKSIVVHADNLYGVCLRLGLISFGFGLNEHKKIAQELGAKRKAIHQSAQKSAIDEIAARTAVQTAETTLATVLKVVSEVEESRKKIASDADISCTSLKEAKDFSAQADEANKAAKAALEAVQEAKAKAKVELDEIVAFYAEIEKHRGEMADAKREAEAKFNELKDKNIAISQDFEKKTQGIIEENVKLQKIIKEHLEKATGVSLFYSFDKRRSGLNFGKWAWIVILLISIGAGVWLTWLIADSISAGKGAIEPAFFVKLSAAIPITFGILFSARQYSNERRVEEEYAFKSAISLSLVPYKDLLQKMKDDGHGEQAAFVEKLLMEIFDNPVSRVYSDGHSKTSKLEKAMTLKDVRSIVAASKDLDIAKVQQLLELLGGNFPGKNKP